MTFGSNVDRTLTDKWERPPTQLELGREDDVLDIGVEVSLSDFTLEHSDVRGDVFEIVGSGTPETPNAKLAKIRLADLANLAVAISGWLDYAENDFGTTTDCVLWSNLGIYSTKSSNRSERIRHR